MTLSTVTHFGRSTAHKIDRRDSPIPHSICFSRIGLESQCAATEGARVWRPTKSHARSRFPFFLGAGAIVHDHLRRPIMHASCALVDFSDSSP
ncbi:hypothetical protein PVAP13_2KG093800 [Panicum virgatum]|uniref:Uncharacterized protein n=1 Tax=Panicum virgatum TaxID=38727 RepID=A0A8T0VZ49_PANVG|nr:hypothetical protein PVAP13_2KG093800 [Panicum virgatum]